MLLLACKQAHLFGVSGEYFAAEPTERAMGLQKISLAGFAGLRWRLYRQGTRPKNTITIKLEIRSLCA